MSVRGRLFPGETPEPEPDAAGRVQQLQLRRAEAGARKAEAEARVAEAKATLAGLGALPARRQRGADRRAGREAVAERQAARAELEQEAAAKREAREKEKAQARAAVEVQKAEAAARKAEAESHAAQAKAKAAAETQEAKRVAAAEREATRAQKEAARAERERKAAAGRGAREQEKAQARAAAETKKAEAGARKAEAETQAAEEKARAAADRLQEQEAKRAAAAEREAVRAQRAAARAEAERDADAMREARRQEKIEARAAAEAQREAKEAAAAAKAEEQAKHAAAKRAAEEEKEALEALRAEPPSLAFEDLGDEVAPGGRQMVYLVTFSGLVPDRAPAPSAAPARDPATFSREEIRDAVLEAVASPAAPAPGRPGRRRAEYKVEKMVVFRETHADGRTHFHVAVKFSDKVKFLPVKEALRERSGLCSHWSASHTMWWSAVRYGAFTTPKKPVVDAGPLVYVGTGGGLNLVEESQEPYTAEARKRKREQKEVEAGGKDEPPPRFTKLDFTALVTAEGLKTKSQVVAYSMEKGTASMRAWVRNNMKRVNEQLEESDEWNAAPAQAAQDNERDKADWALFEHYAAAGTCGCGAGGCRWRGAMEKFFTANPSLDRQRLAACLRDIIVHGPKKTTRVPMIVGPTGTGKSTYFNPLYELFGDEHVINRPPLGSACGSLNGLSMRGMRFIFWDEFSPVDYAHQGTVPVPTFLSLFQGKPCDAQSSQSFHDGHLRTRWNRGACFTAPLAGLWTVRQAAGPGTHAVTAEHIRHMQGRVEQFEAMHKGYADGAMADVPEKCKETFCKLVVDDSTAFAFRAVPVGPGPPAPPGGRDNATVGGFEELMARAGIPAAAARSLLEDITGLGAVTVGELEPGDWRGLRSWDGVLLPLARRRLFTACGWNPREADRAH